MNLLLKGLGRVAEIITKKQRLYCTFRVTSVTLALKQHWWSRAIVGTHSGETRIE